MNQECPPRLLGGCFGDMEDYCSKSLQNLNTVLIWYTSIITNVIINLTSIRNQEQFPRLLGGCSVNMEKIFHYSSGCDYEIIYDVPPPYIWKLYLYFEAFNSHESVVVWAVDWQRRYWPL